MFMSCGQGKADGTAPTVSENAQALPINIVYVNHVEVESVIDNTGPLIQGITYESTPARYTETMNQLRRELSMANAVDAHISFHMSGAFAERAMEAGQKDAWLGILAKGNPIGVHAHSFINTPAPFKWLHELNPTQMQKHTHWAVNRQLVAALVGAETLLMGESHYTCNECWHEQGYTLRSNEQMASLPAGAHMVWSVARDGEGVVSYPHFPQIGEAAEHGLADSRTFFDLRLPQLKKEFLMLYLDWLDRERLGLAPQVWSWGWTNHGGDSTKLYANDIEEMLQWLQGEFIGKTSSKGNLIARFATDHDVHDEFISYEAAGGEPLDVFGTTVNDRFPYMAYALENAGVYADLSASLGESGVRLFELRREYPASTSSVPGHTVLLMYLESGNPDRSINVSPLLASLGFAEGSLESMDVSTGAITTLAAENVKLTYTPLVIELQ